MQLSDIKKQIDGTCGRLSVNAEVRGVALHSRDVRPGWIFVAIPGASIDGLRYAEDAVRRGAVAVVTESVAGERLSVPVITVADARLAAARLAAILNGWPARSLKVVGITGTNGKTTVAHMVRAGLQRSGMVPGMTGTIAYEIGERRIAASRTTPDALTLQDLLRQMVVHGCRSAVMEVSSHALSQSRVADIDFAVAGFTNLTREHLDYHQTMDAYYEAKALLFRRLVGTATAVINRDDAWGVRLLQEPLVCRRLSYGLAPGADIAAETLKLSLEGSTFQVHTPWGAQAVRLLLPGRHNVSNALAAIGLCIAAGADLPSTLQALEGVSMVRGRLERVPAAVPFRVFVDYAHTDDALRHVLAALRPLTPGRLIVVFGCGGNRDRGKRALMGAVAVELADIVVVTSDNPRQESPSVIIDEILVGVGDHPVEVAVERREAIRLALALAREGDTVLIAGKGHETYQEAGGIMAPFNDVDVVQDELATLAKGAS
ncbi:MAG TPA: UDP-N-acetylmuramoyl-L-alanyl-D-glutamate--2,6-diaminopimelate ligase [Verrucomicrobia bacterium]|nr:UDP-N-acetylmuramoyl-L-alanyl-D-glutamate--2,6-diaminopimelate ligase [Verrucomicrobiota bacterium]